MSAKFLEEQILGLGHSLLPVYVDRDRVWHLQDRVQEKSENNIEHQVSIEGKYLRHAEERTEVEFIFPIIHGSTGEDGALQGMAEFFGISYAGCNVLSSAISMHKTFMRQTFAEHGIDQVKYSVITADNYKNKKEATLSEIKSTFNLPIFTKPCNMGSSIGVVKVDDFNHLEKAINESFEFDSEILVEQGHAVREVEVSILGNFNAYQTSSIGEIIVNHSFYSYEAKYLDDHGADLEIPANIIEEQSQKIHRLAKQAFAAIRGDGFARIDFFIDKKSDAVYLNEINTLPGLTSISMFPKLFSDAGLDSKSLIQKIIDLGLEREVTRRNNKITR